MLKYFKNLRWLNNFIVTASLGMNTKHCDDYQFHHVCGVSYIWFDKSNISHSPISLIILKYSLLTLISFRIVPVSFNSHLIFSDVLQTCKIFIEVQYILILNFVVWVLVVIVITMLMIIIIRHGQPEGDARDICTQLDFKQYLKIV